ncbi:MAG: poly(ethylene terephthalate) hydrolase family protein [Polyangiales bacterium]
MIFRSCASAAVLFLLTASCGGSTESPPSDFTPGGDDAASETSGDETSTDDSGGTDDSATTEVGDADPGDTAVDTGVDMGMLPGCAGQPLAVDPASTLDSSKPGPLKTATKMLKFTTSVGDTDVLVTYPVQDDGTTPHPGKHAWIMFHHAVHGPDHVVFDDYPTIHGHWASHGFVVVSIDGSKVFFPTTMGTNLTWAQQNTVASNMDTVITQYLTQQESDTFPLKCSVDPNRLAVAGHSRGGGATLLVPTTRTDGAKIKGLVSLQGVDPGALSPPAGSVIPGFDLPALWLDAALDGDVSFPILPLQYGRTRAWGAMVTILGSKHTFTFDANATPDQGGTPPTITPAEHKAVCVQYSTAFLRANVRDATPNPTDLDRVGGPGGLSSTVSSGGVLLSYRPQYSSTYVAKFDTASPTTPTNDTGADVTVSGGMKVASFETYYTTMLSTGEKAVSAMVHSAQLTWDATGGSADVATGALGSKKAIVFDLAMSSEGTTSGTTPLYLEVTDTAGGIASVPIKDYLGSGWFTRPRRLSTAYVPVSKLTGVDLSKAKTIRFTAKSGATAGVAMIDSLRAE